MLGIRQAITSDVSKKVEQLERQLEEERRRHRAEVDLLKKQLIILAQGQRLTEKAILEGLLYNDVAADALDDFLQATPDALVLDVRSDKEWEGGYIPGAKHIPIDQLSQRLGEMADKKRPILAICASGARSATAADLLTRNGFVAVFNAVGGMHAYRGPVAYPERKELDASTVKGDDRVLIEKVLAILNRDVRPNLQRDGGDLVLLAVNNGVAELKMVGACHGCGSQKVTVEQGIKSHLMEMVPGITGVLDRS